MSQPSTTIARIVGAPRARNRVLGLKWFLARLTFVAVYILVAGFEYNFGAMLYGGWFIFHLMKLAVYLVCSSIVYFMIRSSTHYNARLIILVMDILLLPVVYFIFES